jgi:hypothetical protein
MISLGLFLLAASVTMAADPKDRAITDEDRSHWAFHAVTKVEPPTLKDASWIRNPIDQFVGALLEKANLQVSPEASRETLIRRLTFDLTGLPPSPGEIDDYLHDTKPGAYERVVDRLLASPHYGERWAQHWLDLARYADTDGYEFDQIRPNAWRYRDWVVDAFNRDLGYDEFVRLQLAGDEAATDDPSCFVATGFNRCYPDMVDQNDQGLRRQNALNDITETTGLVFLGLTIGCARCHDHKFDPIRQSDFYRLQAFFGPARFRDDYSIVGSEQRRSHETRMIAWQRTLVELQSRVIGFESPLRSTVRAIPAGIKDDVVLALQKDPLKRSDREISLIYEFERADRRLSDTSIGILMGPAGCVIRSTLIDAVEEQRRRQPTPLPLARGIDEASGPVPPTFLLKRGDFQSRGPLVEPGFPGVLVPEGTKAEITRRGTSTGRRSALAAWLVSPTNPLTSRVMVNRIWQGHFGRGLVATPSDFGLQGSEPTHPELLDWLASQFVESGWSMKTMHRLIVTSATYRQKSSPNRGAEAIDPDNDLLWRQNRRRLDGEAIRDTLLAVAGTLNLKMGGPCVFPELPTELKKLSSKGAIWPVSPTEAERNRRSLYVFTRRNLRYPFFEVFDRPDTNASCPRRPVSTISPQALTLLNGKLAQDAARAFSARVERETPGNPIVTAFRLALGRRPDSAETQLATRFLVASPLEDFFLALINLNEFVYID